MAIWNENYYNGEDTYSDGVVEDEILKFVKASNKDIQSFIGTDFSKAYHLLSIRENIVNWYPFEENQSALEIGAGCGAITGVLCAKLRKVVSVDLSKRRSKINYERHKEYDNLTIMIGNLNDMEFDELFDYVILNGVFEYAISFTNGKKPYHAFLNKISKFLKPSGKVLIAIENKLGLKYFNGSKEDHTGNYFVGLNGYENNNTVRTFTKQELKNILNDVGFVHTRFYYPYPDYKFPNEIFTDDSIEKYHYGKRYLNCEEGRYCLFNEYEVGQYLIKEGIRGNFANSFFIEASKDKIDTDILYVKLNSDRKEELRIGTAILSGGKVLKFPLNTYASKHIEEIEKNENNWNGKKVYYLKGKRINNYLVYKYIQEKNLDSQISELIQDKKTEVIIELLQAFYGCYRNEFEEIKKTNDFYSSNFVELFGNKKLNNFQLCVRNVNIDIILDNVFKVKDNYIVIDGEWVYNDWIPYNFAVWRSLNELFGKYAELEKLISKESIYNLFNIEKCDIEVYREWARYFAEEYVGSKQLQQIEKIIIPFSLDQEYQRKKNESRVTMALYIDRGEGFAEETKLYQTVDLIDNHFEIRFVLNKARNIIKMRFDPVEKMVCSCCIEELSEGFYILSNNSDETNERLDYFYNGDPQYLLQIKENSGMDIEDSCEIYIKGVLNIIQNEQLNDIFFKVQANNLKLDKCNQMYTSIINELQKRVEQVSLEKQKMKDSLEECKEEKEYLINNTRAYIKKKIQKKWKE